jgi:capsular polysaccharide biosynthesis protein
MFMNQDAGRLQAIHVETIARLVSGDPEVVVPEGLTYLDDLAELPAYRRKLPFRVDAAESDSDQWPWLEAYFAQEIAESDNVRHLRIANAVVVGQGAVIAGETCLIRESAAEFLAHGNTPDGLVQLEEGGFALKTPPTVVVEKPSLLLKRPWYGNYGHWLVDNAALLSLASQLTLPGEWQIVTGRYVGGLQAIVRETLEILAPGVAVIEHPDDEAWRFAELHYVSPVHIPPLFKLPVGLACLRAQILRGLLAHGTPRRAIYVMREAHVRRKLWNEDAVIALCQEFGIEIVSPERMSLRDQAGLFHGASLVVGVKGAGLTNALFCTPRAHVIALSPGDFPDPFFWDLVGQFGGNYSEIFGALVGRDRAQSENPFTIDVGRLRAVLTACIADIART